MSYEPPVRLCCMTRHTGPTCPDGTFMCVICFEKVPVDDSYQGTDICRTCGVREESA